MLKFCPFRWEEQLKLILTFCVVGSLSFLIASWNVKKKKQTNKTNKQKKKTMVQSDHLESSSICDKFTDAQNWTDQNISPEFFKPTSILLELIFIPVVFVIGFVGNVAFVLLVARVKTMRTTINFYLANIAVADLITLFLVTITRLWRYAIFKQIQSSPLRTNFGCAMYAFTIHWSSLSSVFIIAIVSFDRYFAICRPLRYRITTIKKRASLRGRNWMLLAHRP